MNAILLASAGVAIFLVGGGVGFWVGRSGIGGSKARVEKAEAELEEYKRNVTEHFGRTAAHFQAIGKQYRELYEHMANGAQSLCESDEAGKTLLFAPGAVAPATNLKASTEPAAETETQQPSDYGEQPVAEDAAEGPDSEKANEPQSESKVEAEKRTIH